jgi:hypothetical protein
LAFLLANGLVLLFGDRFSVSLPQVAIADRLFVVLRDDLPQTLAGLSATITLYEGHDLARLSAQSQPNPHLLALTIDKGAQFIQFEYLLLLLRSFGCLREEEALFEVDLLYFFLSQLMTVVGETPKVRLSPLKLERSW